MSLVTLESLPPSRLKALLDHFGEIDDPRVPWQVAHPLPEVLLLVVCGTICDCEDYDLIAEWGEAHLPILRRYLPYHHGVPGGRWLTILMNRIDPHLFAQAFTDWVRATWPQRPDFVAIDGKTARRSHDRATGKPPLHLVSAFATTSRLVHGQEAVPDKASETTAIPILIERLSENDGLKGALVSIDAIATNPSIAATITAAGADYLLAVKANQPTLRSEVESLFGAAVADEVETITEHDKGHGRIEERRVSVARQVDWLDGPRRFPGETRLPGVACLVRVQARAKLKDRRRTETRYYVSSAALTAQRAADAVRGHWAIENSLHWVLDVIFADDQSRLRKGHGARNMAVVRHFALNLVRAISDKRSIKLRRKRAGWDPTYLAAISVNSAVNPDSEPWLMTWDAKVEFTATVGLRAHFYALCLDDRQPWLRSASAAPPLSADQSPHKSLEQSFLDPAPEPAVDHTPRRESRRQRPPPARKCQAVPVSTRVSA